jgi:hypothetical protein
LSAALGERQVAELVEHHQVEARQKFFHAPGVVALRQRAGRRFPCRAWPG